MMTNASAVDEVRAHRHFSAACFNRAWDFLDLDRRDELQIEEMLHAAHASMWHWLHVPERTPTNDSIGTWQLARAYAVAGRAEEALRWARRCLAISEDSAVGPFYLAYAHEAAARAEAVAGRSAESTALVTEARALLARIDDAEDRDRLARDLDDIMSTIERGGE
jgi:hypothetical protein